MLIKCILFTILQFSTQFCFTLSQHLNSASCNANIIEIPAPNSTKSRSIPQFTSTNNKLENPEQLLFLNSTESSIILQNGSLFRNRFKRSVSLERYIEILIVLDSSMYDYHGKALEKYIFAQMAMVSHIFKHYTIGQPITLKIVSITLLMDDTNQILYDTPHNLLSSFCRWQNKRNHPSDASLEHHDTAMFLTRKKLCGTLKDCSMVGLANVGQICNPINSCFIVEDTGLGGAFTIAHELGHVLGIPHDDQGHCVRFYQEKEKNKRKKKKKKSGKLGPEKGNIMASVQTGINQIWAWSSCSRHFIKQHLNAAGKCLLEDQAHPSQADPSHRFAGRFFDVHKQCSLRFTASSQACDTIDICSRLWCSNAKGGCMSDNTPWADGTRCGIGRWCYQGACVKVEDSMEVVDGKWGPWSSWTVCSKDCGKGSQTSKRKCNRPKPKNGGHYCVGQRFRTRPCNTHPCKKAESNKKNIMFEKKEKRLKNKKNNRKSRKIKFKSAVEDWFKY